MQNRTFISGHVRRLSGFEVTTSKLYGSVIFGKYIKLFMKRLFSQKSLP